MLILLMAGLGLILGSFINALVWRLHLSDEPRATSAESKPGTAHSKLAARNSELSVWRGRSICPHCRQQLRWYDLVPVVSWLVLRGRCRDCHRPISLQYPLVELLTATVFALSVAALRPVNAAGGIYLLAWLAVALSLITLTIYDARWYLLPDRLLLPALVPATVMVLVQLRLSHSLTPLWHHALAAAAGASAFYALTVVSQGRWLGGGDVKLLFLMGWILGPALLVVALLVAFDTAAVVGVILIASGRKTRKDYLPFGPFLALGTVVALLYGQTLINFYLGLLGS